MPPNVKASGMEVLARAQTLEGLGTLLAAYGQLLSPRMADLAEKAADALDNGIDPLHNGFLSEHEVTLDECYNLAELMANALRLLLAMRDKREG